MHAPLPPSGANRWGRCAQSVRLEAMFPDDPDDFASQEGTAAHQFATDMLKGIAHKVGTPAANGVIFTDEMREGAELLLATVAPLWTSEVYVESPVICSEIHAQCWGTPDVVIIDRANKIVRVVDYKFGHRFVDAWENFQLVCYAHGATETYGVEGFGWTFELVIVQPRYYQAEPTRSWTIDSHTLAHHVGELQRMAGRAFSENSAATTGHHCKDCNARHSCKTLARVVSWAVDESSSGEARDLNPDTIGTELTILRAASERLKARLDGLEAHAVSMLRGGKAITGWKLEPKFGREQWTQDAADVIALGAALGVNLAKPATTITPNQARKLLGPNAPVVDQFATKPSRGHELAPLTEQSVKKVFAK